MSFLRIAPLSATLTCLALILAACAGTRALSELPSTELSGIYTERADGQWFRPCASDPAEEAWWVTFTDGAVTQRESGAYADLLAHPDGAYVRWLAASGDRAEGAPDGPGPGARYVLVRDILEVSSEIPVDCLTRERQ